MRIRNSHNSKSVPKANPDKSDNKIRTAGANIKFSTVISDAKTTEQQNIQEKISPNTAILDTSPIAASQQSEQSQKVENQILNHADNILDELDKLKKHILTGNADKQNQQKLLQLASQETPKAADNELKAILQQIKLRLLIEIAKNNRQNAVNKISH